METETVEGINWFENSKHHSFGVC